MVWVGRCCLLAPWPLFFSGFKAWRDYLCCPLLPHSGTKVRVSGWYVYNEGLPSPRLSACDTPEQAHCLTFLYTSMTISTMSVFCVHGSKYTSANVVFCYFHGSNIFFLGRFLPSMVFKRTFYFTHYSQLVHRPNSGGPIPVIKTWTNY